MVKSRGIDIESLSGLRKAAILMVMIETKLPVSFLRQLDEDEVQLIGREIAGCLPQTEEAETCWRSFTRWASPMNTSSKVESITPEKS